MNGRLPVMKGVQSADGMSCDCGTTKRGGQARKLKYNTKLLQFPLAQLKLFGGSTSLLDMK